MAECRELAAWAEALPAQRDPVATPREIGRHLRFIDATLPTRHVEHDTGQQRLAVYVSILRDLTEPQLAHMSRAACQRLKWFPTPAECLALAAEYQVGPSEQETTLALCARRVEKIAADWIAAPDLSQDVPDQWTRIAVERGTLRRMPGGSIVIRSKYHGPFRSA